MTGHDYAPLVIAAGFALLLAVFGAGEVAQTVYEALLYGGL
jgi:hypothetical protein